MPRKSNKTSSLEIAGVSIALGATRDVRLPICQNLTGNESAIPLRVMRGKSPGPTLLVTAAAHGDEINGSGIVHDLMYGKLFELKRGSLILVPVLNIYGLESQDRYMPDRRDLNRVFPGSAKGSLAARIARIVFENLVKKADYCIDFHSAAARRTNYPNVRGDLSNKTVLKLARSFGCELIVDGQGPAGSLRREATKAGVPTIILEAGEVSKIEPGVLELGIRGVRNVMAHLGMIETKPIVPAYQTRLKQTTWVRAEFGGLLRFHITPGDLVEQNEAIATNFGIYGETQNVLRAPFAGIVLGMTMLPIVRPGEPVCHLALPDIPLGVIRKAAGKTKPNHLLHRVRRHLATSFRTERHRK